MGTNRTRNSSSGSNRSRNGIELDAKTWDEAVDTWDGTNDTWDTYGKFVVTTSGTKRTRNSTAVGSNRSRN